MALLSMDMPFDSAEKAKALYAFADSIARYFLWNAMSSAVSSMLECSSRAGAGITIEAVKGSKYS
ncbi:hypothetical protein D3C77_781160 [compost metagenome]